MSQRRFNSLADAKRYIYGALHTTLESDLHGNASGYIYEMGFSERDQERVEKAGHQVLEELERKSKPRDVSRRRRRP